MGSISYLAFLKERYPGESSNDVYDSFAKMLFGDSRARKHAISRLVGYFVPACVIEEVNGLCEPLIRFRIGMRVEAMTFLNALKKLVYEVVIRSPSVQHLEFKGQQMVVAVFEVFCSEPDSFLPAETFQAYKAAGNSPRVICDHVAGMTDSFLLKTYERFFSPRMGSVFDRL
jgi:dGTPase